MLDKPSHARLNDSQSSPERYQISVRPDLSVEKPPAPNHATGSAADVQRAGFPAVAVHDYKGDFQKAMFDRNASPQDRLKAAEALASAGVRQVTVVDGDKTRQMRVEVEGDGKHKMVHVFAADNDGHERVVLRGIDNGNGSFSQERDKHGKQVDYGGTWWESHMSDCSKLGACSTDSRKTLPDSHSEAPKPADGRSINQPKDKAEKPVEPSKPNEQSKPAQAAKPNEPAKPVEPEKPTKPSEPEKTQGQPKPDVQQKAEADSQNKLTLPQLQSLSQNQAALNALFDRAAASSNAGGHRAGAPVYFVAKMDVDADGSPRARQLDPYGSSNTRLHDQNGRPINAEKVPYIVLPAGKYQHLGIHLGDMAAVRYNGKVQFAVFADTGPSHKLGEGSMELARRLGMSASPLDGGTKSRDVEYMVFPGSRHGRPSDTSVTNAIASRYLAWHAGLQLED